MDLEQAVLIAGSKRSRSSRRQAKVHRTFNGENHAYVQVPAYRRTGSGRIPTVKVGSRNRKEKSKTQRLLLLFPACYTRLKYV